MNDNQDTINNLTIQNEAISTGFKVMNNILFIEFINVFVLGTDFFDRIRTRTSNIELQRSIKNIGIGDRTIKNSY